MKQLVQMFVHTLGFMKLLVQMFAYTRLYEITCTILCIKLALGNYFKKLLCYKCLHTLGFVKLLVQMFVYTRL